MTKQSEALRLVNLLEGDYDPDWLYEIGVDQAAAELRRLQAANQELLGALLTLAGMAESFSDELHKDHPDVTAARAAIAKATGETE